MDLTNFFLRKRIFHESSGKSDNEENPVQMASCGELTPTNSEALPSRSASSKVHRNIVYKAKLSYRREWEIKHPWLYCDDAGHGMFCKLCQKRGNPPSTVRGVWELKIGTTQLSYAKTTASQNGTKTL